MCDAQWRDVAMLKANPDSNRKSAGGEPALKLPPVLITGAVTAGEQRARGVSRDHQDDGQRAGKVDEDDAVRVTGSVVHASRFSLLGSCSRSART